MKLLFEPNAAEVNSVNRSFTSSAKPCHLYKPNGCILGHVKAMKHPDPLGILQNRHFVSET